MSLFVCVYVCEREEGEERGHEVLKSLFCFEGVGSRCVCVGMEGSVHPVCVCKGG